MKGKVISLVIFLLVITCVVMTPVSACESDETVGDVLNEESYYYISFAEMNFSSVYETSSSSESYPTAYVYTPKGTAVEVRLKDETVTDPEGDDQNNKEDYSDITLISPATSLYNCHSYAWYSQNYQTNIYWMDDPANYITDRSYWLVTEPEPGDIIVYASYDYGILHSGIVVEVHDGESNDVCGDSNLVTVQSKWGKSGLYEHPGDECPYTLVAPYYERLDPSVRAYFIADTVMYFRRDSLDHTHTFAEAEHNSDWHKKYCTGCGVTIWEEHDYSVLSTKNSTSHTATCACGDSITQSHSYDYQTYSEHYHKKYCDCGYINYVAHNYEYSYVNDQTHTKTCTLCHASYQDPHYEEAYSVEDNGDGSHDITCICEGIFEEDASHVYNEYSDYNGVYHKVSCICGDCELEAHELYYEYEDGDDYHWEECEICGYEDYPEHSYTTKSYYDLNHHKAYCDCGDYIISHHDNYTEVSHNNSYHTVKVDCCDSRTVTFIHHYDEYDSDSHTGDCSYCSYTATTDLSHVVPYSNIGGGKHSGKCNWCDYTHTEPHSYMYTCISYSSHQIECEGCDNYQVVADHTWDEYYDEEGDLITYCSGCQYIAGSSPLSLDMIEKLPLEIQSALDGATQNALLNATEEQTVSVVIRIDDEYGILYFNGRYYLLYTPIEPDAEVAPVTPSEESIS